MDPLLPSSLKELDRELQNCRKCIAAGYEVAPGAIFSHPIQSHVMLIGQAPGVTEVTAKRPFNAGSGKRLFQWLEQAGWKEEEFRSNCVMTAVTKCYPGKGKSGKGDRVPSRVEQKLCRSYLEREISYYDPKLIILVGGLAIKLFYPSKLRLDEIIGTAAFFEYGTNYDLLTFDINRAINVRSFEDVNQRNGKWIVPLPHPSGASLWPNKKKNRVLINRAIEILGQLRRDFHI